MPTPFAQSTFRWLTFTATPNPQNEFVLRKVSAWNKQLARRSPLLRISDFVILLEFVIRHSSFVIYQPSASFTRADVFVKLRSLEYGKANRRDGDREGHYGTAGHQIDPPEVAGRLQPRFQNRPVHHALLARHAELQTRLLAVIVRARPRVLRDDRETRRQDGHAHRRLGEAWRHDVCHPADREIP